VSDYANMPHKRLIEKIEARAEQTEFESVGKYVTFVRYFLMDLN